MLREQALSGGVESGGFVDYESQITDSDLETQVGGVEWRKLEVDDPYSNRSMYEAVRMQSKIAHWNHHFASDPNIQRAPTVHPVTKKITPHNSVSEEIYGRHPAMYNWRSQLVPSAMALMPMQQPMVKRLYDGFPIDEDSRLFYLHALDAIAIRSRATIMQQIAGSALSSRLDLSGNARVISVASGTALPVVDAVRQLRGNIHLDLVDIDPEAHRMAANHLSEDEDLGHITHTPHNRNIRKGLIAGDGLVEELGSEQADFVDAMGIFEYIPNDPRPSREGSAVKFLRNLHRLVRPGGTLVFGNMLSTHPQLDFNQYGIGWPRIHPRSREEIVEIIKTADIDPAHVTVYEAQDAGYEDGVYAVVEVRKPTEGSTSD